MFFYKYPVVGNGGLAYVDSGDAAAVDYDVNDFTKDSAYHILDISSKVGAGVRLVHIKIVVVATTADEHFEIKTNGNTYERNVFSSGDMPANEPQVRSDWVYTDADGKIEYRISSGTYTAFDMIIRGWFE